jgi:SAM-dependent methyltransferase
METTTCIFCGSSSSHVAISENGYQGLKCHNCNLIYISPKPSPEEIQQLYADDHAVLYADAQFQFEQFKKIEASRTLSKMLKYRMSGSLLELGPGGGIFLLQARKYGFQPYGIELNLIEARWINENLHIPCESVPLSATSFEGRRFDIIYHRDVLSHLYDPISVFQNINRALNADGLLVFETGNIADVRDRYYHWFSQFLYPDHLFFFGERSLGILLERTGFKCLSICREGIALQLLLQRMLWKLKDHLKDRRVAEDLRLERRFDSSASRGTSMKRRLRHMYRFVSYYLTKLGAILPKDGWPLKLLVIAQKESDLV